jgi:hypothetical protein
MTCIGDRFWSRQVARAQLAMQEFRYAWLLQFFRASEPDPAATALSAVSVRGRRQDIVCAQ